MCVCVSLYQCGSEGCWQFHLVILVQYETPQKMHVKNSCSWNRIPPTSKQKSYKFISTRNTDLVSKLFMKRRSKLVCENDYVNWYIIITCSDKELMIRDVIHTYPHDVCIKLMRLAFRNQQLSVWVAVHYKHRTSSLIHFVPVSVHHFDYSLVVTGSSMYSHHQKRSTTFPLL